MAGPRIAASQTSRGIGVGRGGGGQQPSARRDHPGDEDPLIDEVEGSQVVADVSASPNRRPCDVAASEGEKAETGVGQ